MSTNESDHNSTQQTSRNSIASSPSSSLSSSSSSSSSPSPSASETVSPNDGRRRTQTVSSALHAFLNVMNEHGDGMTGREVFQIAQRSIRNETTSNIMRRFLERLDIEGILPMTTQGVDDTFLDSLERVDVKSLPDTAECPICTINFVDNSYPLIVKLPCHTNGKASKQHMFDMDCIAPWLKANSTCPMCRFNVLDAGKARKAQLEEELRLAREEEEEDDEDEDDEDDDRDLYG